MSELPKFRRPAMLDPNLANELPGGLDPAVTSELAHSSAAALVSRARHQAPQDPELVQRILGLVEQEGIEALASLWANAPAESLPGALWRVFMLRHWVCHAPQLAADRYRQGMAHHEVADAVAGVAHPPGPDEMCQLADLVLGGMFAGELDVALDRAAGFARVVATGAAFEADLVDPSAPTQAAEITQAAASLVGTADALQRAAARWRAGVLD